MRMLIGFVLTFAPPFEPPNVITEIDSGNQSRLAQSHQIAIDGRPIVAQGRERRRDVGVAERSCRLPQLMQDGQPSVRTAQTGVVEAARQIQRSALVCLIFIRPLLCKARKARAMARSRHDEQFRMVGQLEV